MTGQESTSTLRQDYQNHAFTLQLRDGRRLEVPTDKSVAEVLQAAGVPVDLKCDDGLCGVCKCGVISGDVNRLGMGPPHRRPKGPPLAARYQARGGVAFQFA